MGLSVSLSNALSGMHTTQKGLEILSRNIANAGTPGYHRQSVNISEEVGTNSSYSRLTSVERAFQEATQHLYNKELTSAAYAETRATFLGRVETFLGKPGDPTSLDTLYQEFETSMQELTTSPDDYTTRSEAVSTAQTLATRLNQLTASTQGLRQETENQIANHVSEMNRMLNSLANINVKLNDQRNDQATRASLLDERDRMVGSIAELVDVRVEYRGDDTVSLMTKSGMSLLDSGGPTLFEFDPAGSINASAKFEIDDSKNGVGTLYATTQAGLRVDVVEQGLMQSGRLGALFELRDETLTDVQNQLDEIASGLAQAMSTVNGEEVTTGADEKGYQLDLAGIENGQNFTFSYSVNGTRHDVRVVRDDSVSSPTETTGPNGQRVITMDFSGGEAGVATQLNSLGFADIGISAQTVGSEDVLQIVDDGAANTSSINYLRTHATSTQGQGLGLALFTDQGGKTFTDSLAGDGQQLGFAGRISVNTEVVANSELLVKYASGTPLGDDSRPNALLANLENMTFKGKTVTAAKNGNFELNGTPENLIAQMMNYQGNTISSANGDRETADMALDAVSQRMDSETGVNIDEEMSRLIELQNSYAAAARVVSTTQELIDRLMAI